ncbi:hypothetical protein ACKGJO_04865 [Gracilimonas sp. Q87]|uniref:hypothetical protein n=1 Tax=Gracilimonas sp. Q87 TaxID=3384766 RepID=UPI0039840C27
MINTFKVLVISTVISFGMIGCSATQETTSPQQTESQDIAYPSWYEQVMFQTDSTSFIGYGEAVALDSVTAIKNAELQARVNLEAGVSEIIEETRESISDKGNETVNTPEFLIMLRNASQAIQKEGTIANKTSLNKDSYFRGYATVRISRSEALTTLRTGFEANQGYWRILNDSSLFQ